MSLSSIVIFNNVAYVNYNSGCSVTNSYPIEVGSDGDKYIVFPDSVEFACFVDDLEEEFEKLNLGAYCFGGDWEDNALCLSEVIAFLKKNEVSVIDHNEE